ncbi:RICIN domain-containing protein [Actinoplanes sp. LDG1-06]|uniref:RICIN domain-containing protein n=1 Tax=Paractinoplanes ovalisporus TaxID=2810368 RepID=A0ABS2AGI3_9ACTN|nr:RICIN domain-containing protein [Actinoplanes ovalisporus]MBM2618925.1 RICIN domain-containing protein [Actinoplanes ovalisporus]
MTLFARDRGRSDDGSMPLAMLVVVVGLALTILTALSITRGEVDTRAAVSRTTALQSARTGLASGLASLRAAVGVGNAGLLTALPCSTGAAQLTGTATAKAGTYATTVWYLKTDPGQQDETWVRANGVTCATAMLEIPRYARVYSEGTSSDGKYKRTLVGTYQFRLRAAGNMPGGQIRVYRVPSATQDYCLTANTPAVGMPLTMSVCATNADGTTVDKQKFGYMSDITIKLMTSNTSLYPNGLCAQAGAIEAVGQRVELRECGLTTLAYQQWSFDSASNLRGTTDGRNLNAFCWNIVASTQQIVLNNTSGNLNNDSSRKCGLTTTDYQSWNITADAGSGAAGPDSGQLVNFRQFGKCMDYNYGQNPGRNWAFPCKQSPNIAFRDMSQVWNQVWNLPGTGEKGLVSVTKTDNVTKMCLQAPVGGQTRVTVATCPTVAATASADFVWLIRGDKAPTYDEKYRIEGTGAWAGQCLAPLPAAGNPVQADWIGLTACTGDYLQKWNAVPPVSTSGLTGVVEK